MPYMQRITWSGIAIHAGVLPGYPASHGCIRMPMNFAIRMYGWTKNGARVVIAPGDLAPTDISHPLLFTHRPEPRTVTTAPAGAAQLSPVSTPKSDKETVMLTGVPMASQAPNANRVGEANGTDTVRTADASAAASVLVSTAGSAVVPRTDKDQSRPGETAPATESVSTVDAAQPPGDGQAGLTATADSTVEPAADGTAQPLPAATTPPKRTGHIAAFISRKEGKLFVRENFEPLFEAPVTIADGGPLGTHIFTMRAKKDDPKTFQWSVVSMPQRKRLEQASSRRQHMVKEIVSSPADSPTEALDRIRIPDDALRKLAEIFRPGDSLIVSDLGLGRETGRGTDFIIALH